MYTTQATTVSEHKRHPTSGRRRDPWPLAAGAIALVVAMPLVVVLWSLATPSVEIWLHLWRTYLLELVRNTLALLVGVGLGVFLLGTGLAWLVTMYRFPG